MPKENESAEVRVRLREALGAEETVAIQRFGIYLPNKSRSGEIISDIDVWVRRAMILLSQVNGGATAFPPTAGMWLDDNGDPLSEQTTFVYSFIKRADKFVEGLPRIRAYLHKFGRDTDQGEVLVEFADYAFWIRKYDPIEAA